MATWPIARDDGKIIVTPHGDFLFERVDGSDGSCGVHGYPCIHPGVDLAGVAGTPVVAPEGGVLVMWGYGDKRPYRGYGPGYVTLLGYSGRWHLLAHLDAADLTARMTARGATDPGEVIAIHVTEGQQLGVTSTANHVHWELRPERLAGGDRVLSPAEWIRTNGGPVVPTLTPAPALPRRPSSGALVVALLVLLVLAAKGR